LKKADLVLSLDLANFSRFGNKEEFKELLELGYEGMQKKVNQYFWYRKIRYFFYFKKIFLLIAPVKMPEILALPKWLDKLFTKFKKRFS
jgi:NTE family protein